MPSTAKPRIPESPARSAFGAIVDGSDSGVRGFAVEALHGRL